MPTCQNSNCTNIVLDIGGTCQDCYAKQHDVIPAGPQNAARIVRSGTPSPTMGNVEEASVPTPCLTHRQEFDSNCEFCVMNKNGETVSGNIPMAPVGGAGGGSSPTGPTYVPVAAPTSSGRSSPGAGGGGAGAGGTSNAMFPAGENHYGDLGPGQPPAPDATYGDLSTPSTSGRATPDAAYLYTQPAPSAPYWCAPLHAEALPRPAGYFPTAETFNRYIYVERRSGAFANDRYDVLDPTGEDIYDEAPLVADGNEGEDLYGELRGSSRSSSPSVVELYATPAVNTPPPSADEYFDVVPNDGGMVPSSRSSTPPREQTYLDVVPNDGGMVPSRGIRSSRAGVPSAFTALEDESTSDSLPAALQSRRGMHVASGGIMVVGDGGQTYSESYPKDEVECVGTVSGWEIYRIKLDAPYQSASADGSTGSIHSSGGGSSGSNTSGSGGSSGSTTPQLPLGGGSSGSTPALLAGGGGATPHIPIQPYECMQCRKSCTVDGYPARDVGATQNPVFRGPAAVVTNAPCIACQKKALAHEKKVLARKWWAKRALYAIVLLIAFIVMCLAFAGVFSSDTDNSNDSNDIDNGEGEVGEVGEVGEAGEAIISTTIPGTSTTFTGTSTKFISTGTSTTTPVGGLVDTIMRCVNGLMYNYTGNVSGPFGNCSNTSGNSGFSGSGDGSGSSGDGSGNGRGDDSGGDLMTIAAGLLTTVQGIMNRISTTPTTTPRPPLSSTPTSTPFLTEDQCTINLYGSRWGVSGQSEQCCSLGEDGFLALSEVCKTFYYKFKDVYRESPDSYTLGVNGCVDGTYETAPVWSSLDCTLKSLGGRLRGRRVQMSAQEAHAIADNVSANLIAQQRLTGNVTILPSDDQWQMWLYGIPALAGVGFMMGIIWARVKANLQSQR